MFTESGCCRITVTKLPYFYRCMYIDRYPNSTYWSTPTQNVAYLKLAEKSVEKMWKEEEPLDSTSSKKSDL
jgi:hypothetical protein